MHCQVSSKSLQYLLTRRAQHKNGVDSFFGENVRSIARLRRLWSSFGSWQSVMFMCNSVVTPTQQKTENCEVHRLTSYTLCCRKVYHQTSIDSSTSSNCCPIPVTFGTVIIEWICHRRWFNFSPHLFSIYALPWEMFKSWKSRTGRKGASFWK